jgi:16S rRNA (cytidine1402-2'-O)-methyltransferase
MQSYNDHNAGDRLLLLEKLLRDGQTVALVTDAGMPGISDPAFRAVKKALDMGAGIRVVPGPSAVTAALVASGLAVDRFSFEGFLPRKKGNRRRRLEEIADYRGTLVFFVGPHHLSRYLAEMLEVLGNRPACVARELTKVHEEFVRGTLEGLELQYRNSEVRGEITLLVGKAKPD